jgi:hypothetical protein
MNLDTARREGVPYNTLPPHTTSDSLTLASHHLLLPANQLAPSAFSSMTSNIRQLSAPTFSFALHSSPFRHRNFTIFIELLFPFHPAPPRALLAFRPKTSGHAAAQYRSTYQLLGEEKYGNGKRDAGISQEEEQRSNAWAACFGDADWTAP